MNCAADVRLRILAFIEVICEYHCDKPLTSFCSGSDGSSIKVDMSSETSFVSRLTITTSSSIPGMRSTRGISDVCTPITNGMGAVR